MESEFSSLTTTPNWRFVVDGVDTAVPVTPRYTTNSADAAIGHAERGGGLARVLAYQAADAVRAGRLRVVLSRYEPAPLRIQVVFPSSRLLSAKVRAFVDLVATCSWQFVDIA